MTTGNELTFGDMKKFVERYRSYLNDNVPVVLLTEIGYKSIMTITHYSGTMQDTTNRINFEGVEHILIPVKL